MAVYIWSVRVCLIQQASVDDVGMFISKWAASFQEPLWLIVDQGY